MAAKKKIVASGVSQNLQQAIDVEWVATERSDAAEKALIREYHYHLLRAEELSVFLRNCGVLLDEEV
jgi:hypothetical protein